MKARIEISKHLILVNSTSALLRKVLSLGVLVWLQQYLLRRISTEEYSLLPTLFALIVFLPLLTTMFVSGLRRYVTDAYARGAEDEVTGLVSTMLPILCAVALGLLAVGGTCAWYIDHILVVDPRFLGQARLMFGLLIVGASVRVAVGALGLGFDLKQRFLLRNMIGLGAELVRTAILVALLTVSTRVMWVVVANTAATLLELLVVTRVSMSLVPCLRFRWGRFRRETARPLLSFGGWSVLNQFCFMIREAADPLILNRLASPLAVANFHIGSLVDRHVRTTFLQSAFAAQPVITALNATGQQERLQRSYLRLTRYSLCALGFLAWPLIVFRRELFILYLRETSYTYAAIPVIMALLLGRVIVIFPNSVMGMLAAAKEEVRAVALRGAIITTGNLALTFYLVGVRDMGAVGSALATLIATLIGAPTLNWTLGLRLSGASFRDWMTRTFLPGMLPALCAFPVWMTWHLVAPPETWSALVLAGAAGGVVYVLATWFLAMPPAERREAAGYFARLRRR